MTALNVAQRPREIGRVRKSVFATRSSPLYKSLGPSGTRRLTMSQETTTEVRGILFEIRKTEIMSATFYVFSFESYQEENALREKTESTRLLSKRRAG